MQYAPIILLLVPVIAVWLALKEPTKVFPPALIPVLAFPYPTRVL